MKLRLDVLALNVLLRAYLSYTSDLGSTRYERTYYYVRHT
jgi:hypothetical protein